MKLTARMRRELPRSEFVYPKKRAYPVENRSHAANALARVSQFGTASEKAKVRATVHRRYPGMGMKR